MTPRKGFLSSSISMVAILTIFLSADKAFAQAKIEQMIVTATKRAQDIQSVPASISAFSGEALENRQVKTVEDLTQTTPNLAFSKSFGLFQMSIRGVSPDGFSTYLDPTVAVHIDGVYQPRSTGILSLVMTDLDSVEVLRGPQGTLYGRNANAGVVNLNTRKPTDTFEASATVFGGNYGRYGAKGYVSGPIADGISMRVTGLVDRMSGYGRNLTNGHRINADYMYGGRVGIRLEPVDNLTVDLSATYFFDHNTNGFYLHSLPRGTNRDNQVASGADARYTLAPNKVYASFDPEETTKSTSLTAIATWDINPNMSLKSISGWQRFRQLNINDVDFTPDNYIYGTNPADSAYSVSQEFNFNAKLFDRLDLVLGLYYLRDNIYGGAKTTLVTGNPYGNAATAPLFLHNMQYQRSTSKAIFLDTTLSITDDLRLLAGVRRTFDHRETIQDSFIRIGIEDGTVIAGCRELHVPEQDYTSTTGKVGLQYDITSDVMAYVQWQNGFKTGGYFPAVCGNAYLPETIKSWEGGIKSTLFDGSLTLNASVFHYDYTNMQLSRSTFASAVIDNAASSTIKGAEIEATAYLTDDLHAELSMGFLDTKLGKGFTARNSAEIGNPLLDLSGNKLPRAPSMTLNGALEHSIRIGDLGELTSRGEVSYSSRVWFTPFNEAISQQGPYTLWNAIFTFEPDDCNLTLRAYVRNIFDKRYISGSNTSGIQIYSRGTWGMPRTFGGEITAKF